MSTSNRTFTPRLGRGLRAVALAAAATVGAISIAAGPASAHHPDQSVEVIVPQISTHAVEAMDALARFEAGDMAALKTYQQQRAYAAILTAHHLGYSEQEMVWAWSTTPIDHQRAVLAALTQLGVPYRRVSSIEGVGFDCSGLTSYAWRAGGHELFRNSSAQISGAATSPTASGTPSASALPPAEQEARRSAAGSTLPSPPRVGSVRSGSPPSRL